jgi:hypothetical protein
MRSSKVARLRPRRAAAPCGPPTTQLVSCSTCRMCARSTSASVWPLAGAEEVDLVLGKDVLFEAADMDDAHHAMAANQGQDAARLEPLSDRGLVNGRIVPLLVRGLDDHGLACQKCAPRG